MPAPRAPQLPRMVSLASVTWPLTIDTNYRMKHPCGNKRIDFLVSAVAILGSDTGMQMSFIFASARARSGRAYLREQIIRKPPGRVVRNAAPVNTAHVTGRAGGHEHVASGQLCRGAS